MYFSFEIAFSIQTNLKYVIRYNCIFQRINIIRDGECSENPIIQQNAVHNWKISFSNRWPFEAISLVASIKTNDNFFHLNGLNDKPF